MTTRYLDTPIFTSLRASSDAGRRTSAFYLSAKAPRPLRGRRAARPSASGTGPLQATNYMRAAGLRILDRHLFLTLATLANDLTLVVHDDLAGIAAWCAMPPRAVARSLAQLERHRMIERATHTPCECHSADWTLRVRPYDEWVSAPKRVSQGARTREIEKGDSTR